MSNAILDLIRNRDKFYVLSTKQRLNKNFRSKFIDHRSRVIALNLEAKREYFTGRLETSNAENYPRKFWSVTNEIFFNRSSYKRNATLRLKLADKIISEECDVAKTFNRSVVPISPSVALPRDVEISCTFHMQRTSEPEITNVIVSLKSSAANGYDGVPIKFFKH